MQVSNDASILYSSEDQRTSGLDDLLLSSSSRGTSSRGQHVSVCSPTLVLSVVFFVAELRLRKLVMFCALLGPAADTVFGVDVLVLLSLFFFQLHKDCFCFPQLLLFARLHLASVLSKTRSVVWIRVALG